MKVTKETKGITLLALIITIIVLVILAGIALNALVGNNGILDNSKYSTEQYKMSAEKEAIELAFADLKLKLYADDNVTEITAGLIEQQLTATGNNVEVTDGENGGFVITFTDTGDIYEVSETGKIKGEDKTEPVQRLQIALEITGDIEATGGETTILVEVATNTEEGATFIYHYQLEGGTEQTATSNSGTYTIEGLIVNNNYDVWVEAYNSYNTEHAISSHITVRTQYGPYITVPADFAYNGNTITGFDINAESGVATMATSGDRNVILVIPEYALDGETLITTIANNAFKNCIKIIRTELSNNIVTIGESAFNGCSSLTNISGASGVKTISNYAFNGCSALTNADINVLLHEGLETLGGQVFSASNVTKVIIPQSLKTCNTVYGDDGPFSYCSSLKEVEFANDTETVLPYLFSKSCTGLEKITIPTSVTSIGNYAFKGCSSLTNISGASGVKTISNYAFNGCSALTNTDINVLLHEGLETLGGQVFSASNVTKVIIPKSLKTCNTVYGDDGPFSYCSSLKEVEFANGTETIIPYLFSKCCTNLETITIPNSVTSIGNYAFKGCVKITGIAIPSSVITIGISAFNGCSSLTNISGASGVKTISNYAFNGCSALTNADINVLLHEGLETLGGQVFSASNVTKVIIPKSLKTCNTVYGDDGPFSYCSSLKEVEFANGTETIIPYLFSKCCTGLDTITISNSITSIGNYAFKGCTGLTNIGLPSSITTIGGGAFSGCTGLTSIELSSSATTIGEGAFSGCTKITGIAIPSSVTTIGISAFNGCSSLTNISGASGVKTISNYAFNGCSALTNADINVLLHEGLETLGGQVFSASNVTKVIIPKSLKTCNTVYGDDGPFSYCSSLKEVEFANGTETILQYLFSKSCTGIETIIIPNSVTSIGNYAFKGCTGLTTITYNSTAYTQLATLKSALTAAGVTYNNDNSFINVSLSGDQ